MKQIGLLILLVGFILPSCISQPVSRPNNVRLKETNNLEQLDAQVQRMVQKVAPACVSVITHEPLGGSSSGMGASGVCVSENGIIMTAGHMVIPGGKYEIIFDDGRKVPAKGLGKIGKLDAGLLQISKEGTYPFAEMGYSSVLKEGEMCFSYSYPGSFRPKRVVRMGYIRKVSTDINGDVRTNYLLNTCLMEPGDSGGPLFDMNGRVIGTRSYIGQAVDENYDCPVDVFRRFWTALRVPENYFVVPEEDQFVVPEKEKKRNVFLWPDIASKIQELNKEFSQFTVSISGDGKKAFGTLVDFKMFLKTSALTKDAVYVVSKSSEVSDHPSVVFNGTEQNAKILFRDPPSDLVLLQVKGKSKNAVQVADNSKPDLVGTILLSPQPGGGGYAGVLGYGLSDFPPYYYVGYLGMRLEQWDGKNVITTVQPNTPASIAGLQAGDVITRIDDVDINIPEDFINVLQTKKPGDKISLIRIKNGLADTLSVVLQSRPFKGINHISEEFEGGRSDRRDGLNNVFIHDMPIKPYECGGPVFNLNGDFAGINTARYSRVGSLAIGVESVYVFLEKAAMEIK